MLLWSETAVYVNIVCLLLEAAKKDCYRRCFNILGVDGGLELDDRLLAGLGRCRQRR